MSNLLKKRLTLHIVTYLVLYYSTVCDPTRSYTVADSSKSRYWLHDTLRELTQLSSEALHVTQSHSW
jgi:hypothetical protein